ncbi:ITIH3, partial [Symbiodinium microadriaticum]
MMDPVVDPEGNSYERNAIIAWLKQNSNSPITRSPLRIDQLIPNRSLRKAIEDEIANGTLARSNARSDSKHESKTVEEIGPSGLKSSPEPLDPVRLTITSGGLVSEVSDDGSVAVRVMTSIIPPDSSTRCPADVVCVVDVSGSMGGNASLPGATEFSGLSLLDIVKHALKTIINTLQPDDRFALISYSDVAKVVFCLTPLNGAGKARALSLIESLEPDGLTNLWDGLLKGMDVLAASRSPAADIRNCCLLLLTDGVPNVDIAVEGGGMYAFIPDSGFVGTAFVNALSNQLVSFGTQAFLSLEWQLDDERDVIGNPNCSFASWGTNIDIGNLHYGQRRDFVVRLKVPRDLVTSSDCLVSATLKYKTLPVNDGSVAAVPGTDEVILTSEIWDNSPQQHVEAEVQWLRCRLVDFISERMDEGVSPNSPADSVLAQEMRTWLHAHALGKRDVDEGKAVARVEGLLQDLTGQITEAVSKEQYFCRWGMHYLPSLQRAHALQQCNNFKDPGIQFYGGSLFTSVRDVADDVFCSMPPPQP